MKKNPKKAALIGLAASVLFGATACAEQPAPDAVYGPPSSMVTTEDNELTGVYGPPVEEITEDHNETPTVYGPPDDQITVEDNELEDVYGPPVDED